MVVWFQGLRQFWIITQAVTPKTSLTSKVLKVIQRDLIIILLHLPRLSQNPGYTSLNKISLLIFPHFRFAATSRTRVGKWLVMTRLMLNGWDLTPLRVCNGPDSTTQKQSGRSRNSSWIKDSAEVWSGPSTSTTLATCAAASTTPSWGPSTAFSGTTACRIRAATSRPRPPRPSRPLTTSTRTPFTGHPGFLPLHAILPSQAFITQTSMPKPLL